ncbi:hypothetical protein TrST_g562 [Triparma strigata]|uniref:Uncharacterized protein n=1 Tax=Triparma strigata TaxID=1606541 RepID=A0A9W7BQ39_9STRA|nr:hypothetical protein TrST_g562 [Triparma strigata]
MDVSLSKLLSDLDGFVKKREDGTSLTFKAIKDKEESANNAAHKMNTALEMLDADTDHDRTGISDSPVLNIPNTTSENIPKKADTPEVNWDKLFQTGNLNVDEHLEKLKKQKEKRKKLMDYAKSNAPTQAKPKDPFRSYSARRTSVNPLDSLTKVDKLLLQMKISPSPSPLPSPRNSSSTFDYNKSQKARDVTKKVGDLVKDTAALTKRAVGMAEEETRIKTPAEKKRKTRAKPKPAPKPPSITLQKQQKQQELMDIILGPSVLPKKKKKKRPKKVRQQEHQQQQQQQSLMARTSPSSTSPVPETHDIDVDDYSLALDDLMSQTAPPPHFTQNPKPNTHPKKRKKKARRQNNNNNIADNPYNLNVRPGKFNVPSFTPVVKHAPNATAPLSGNALRLLEMKKRQDKHISDLRKEESKELIQKAADLRTSKELLEKTYMPPKFSTVEEAKIHYERQQLERQGMELLAPMKHKKQQFGKSPARNASYSNNNNPPSNRKKKPARLSPINLKESNELLDCMDDLLLQIAILTSRLNKLQKVETSNETRHENLELLECLTVVGTHINKHKEVMENDRDGIKSSHVSILKSAQTWRLTLLSIVDTLNQRKEEEGRTSSNSEVESDIPVVVADPAGTSPAPSPKKFSHLDGIEDDRVRQRLLLKIAEGLEGEGKSHGSPAVKGNEEMRAIYESPDRALGSLPSLADLGLRP